MWLIHPPVWFLAQLLELPCQSLANLARPSLDLTPVTRLNLKALGESTFQPTKRGCISMFDRRMNELLEQDERVVEANLRNVAGAGVHVPDDKALLCRRDRSTPRPLKRAKAVDAFGQNGSTHESRSIAEMQSRLLCGMHAQSGLGREIGLLTVPRRADKLLRSSSACRERSRLRRKEKT
jgi:hypothetical protein